MKKTILSVIAVLLVTVSGLYYWQAEHRSGPPIKNITIVAFDVTGLNHPQEYQQLKEKVAAINGVTACAISSVSKIASVTFYPDVVTEVDVKTQIAKLGNCKISTHVFAKVDNGCPVDGWRSGLHSFFSFFTI